MARISIQNDGRELLALYLEPMGTDYWLRPGEEFTVVAPAPEHLWPHAVWLFDGDKDGEAPFSITRFRDTEGEAIEVGVNLAGSFTVLGPDGTELECGHQRPVS